MKTDQMKKVFITTLASLSASAMVIPSTMPIFAQDSTTEVASKESLKELEIKKAQLEKELQALNVKVDNKKAEIESTIQNKIDSITAEISKLNKEIDSKQSELDQKTEALKNAESDLEQAKADLESKKSDQSTLQKTIDDYGTLESLNDELTIAKQEHSQAITDFEQAQTPLYNAEKAYYSAIEEAELTREKARIAQINYDDANNRYTEARKNLNAAQEKYDTCSEDEKAQAKIELDECQKTFDDAKDNLEYEDEMLTQRKQDEYNASVVADNALTAYEQAADTFRKASTNLSNAINKEKDLESRINAYDTNYYNSLSKQYESLNKEITELEDEIDSLNSKIESLNQSIEDLSKDLTELKQDVKEKKEELELITSYKTVYNQVLKEGTKADLSSIKDESLKKKMQELASLLEQQSALSSKLAETKKAYEKEKNKQSKDVQTSFETNLLSSAAVFGLSGLALVEIKRRKSKE